jgi:TolA-binding protein
MHAPSLFLALTMALALGLAVSAFAQSTEPVDAAGCAAQQTAIEQDMELARARGQMLRRRQLAEALGALQARCQPAPAAEQSRAAQIERLEQQIRRLRAELAQAEEALRKLTGPAR